MNKIKMTKKLKGDCNIDCHKGKVVRVLSARAAMGMTKVTLTQEGISRMNKRINR